MAPFRAILDTGAGPKLIREEILPEDWERSRLSGTPAYQIIGAGGRPLRQRGVITMQVQLGTLRVQSRFVVVTSLAAECILGCRFINRPVRMILPKDKRVVLANDNVVSILQDSADRPDYGKHSSPEPVPSPPLPSSKVRVARLTVVPPRAEICVEVLCAAPGLCFLQALARGNSLGVYMANGIAGILPNQPFQVRVINTSEIARKITKGMILGHACPIPRGSSPSLTMRKDAVTTESPRKTDKFQVRLMWRCSPSDQTRPQYRIGRMWTGKRGRRTWTWHI
jgi:Retroviral aspartyl protease